MSPVTFIQCSHVISSELRGCSNLCFITHAYMFAKEWIDSYISWNPREYDDVKQVGISITSIWRPDIVLIERLSGRCYILIAS